MRNLRILGISSCFLLKVCAFVRYSHATRRLSSTRVTHYDEPIFMGRYFQTKNVTSQSNPLDTGVHVLVPNNTSVYSALRRQKGYTQTQPQKSENFEVVRKIDVTFDDIGGYANIKEELLQCGDILVNSSKYDGYNVRTPKGVILEGPPGNGKTLVARGLSGTLHVAFIATSGSAFQERYVGVGAARVRELFDLAQKNTPCIIFIDEIDALCRQRGSAHEGSSAERDNTLNELLTQMDGFKSSEGIFLVCATNRIDLLDEAFVRPGRLDKKIHISNPDSKTRSRIIEIHIQGKPHERGIDIPKLVELTNGQSGAAIENILNEAMLLALRRDDTRMRMKDIERTLSRLLSGYKETENIYSPTMLRRIAIHELGHGISGFMLTDHSRVTSINLNPWSPRTPGFTVFETDEIDANIFTREKLFAHLVVLLSGRTAEELFFDQSITTGASHDYEEAMKLANSMIVQYNMGDENVYSRGSDKFKEIVDVEVTNLLTQALEESRTLILNSKLLIDVLVAPLIEKQKLSRDEIEDYAKIYMYRT